MVEPIAALERVSEAARQHSKAAAKAARLCREIGFLEEEERKLVERELKNIEELERDEAAQAVSVEPLFNLDSEVLEVPPGFNWT